jgi:hypothetical protein
MIFSDEECQAHNLLYFLGRLIILIIIREPGGLYTQDEIQIDLQSI